MDYSAWCYDMKDRLFVAGKEIKIGKKTITLPEWAVDYLKGDPGKSVPGKFMQSSWAYRCITIRANALASIEWEIQRPKGDDYEVIEQGPLVDLLREVNPELNWPDLIRATEADMLIYGSAYWLKVRGGSEVQHIMRLNPATMKVKSDKQGISNFEQKIDGKVTPFEREDVVYFHSYHPQDDFGGLSPTQIALAAIDAEINAEKYVGAFFENYAMPAVLLSTEQSVGEPELKRRQRLWERWFKKVEKQHSVAMVDKGLKATTIGYSLKELAMDAVRKEARRSICAVYGVPTTIAGAWEAANFATIKEERLELYQGTIFSEAAYFAGVLNAELVPEFDAGLRFGWRYDKLDIMQEDEGEKAKRIALLVEKGVILPAVGAMALGYEESEAGAGPARPFGVPEMPEEKSVETKVVKSPLRVDLEKWARKAMKRVKEGKSAAVEFESEHVPLALGEAISESLEMAKTKEEVKAIFASTFDYEDMPYTRKRDVNQEQYNELKMMIMALAGKSGGLEISVDNAEFTQKYMPPEVKVIVPKLDVPEVKVDVNVPEAKQVAPIVNVDVNVPQQPPPEVNIDVEFPKVIRERQEVNRDKQGFIESVDGEMRLE